MPLYTGLMAYGVAMPTPAHTLTEGAEYAREALRRHGRAQRPDLAHRSLVTQHGPRRIIPYIASPPAPYARVKALAEAHGFTITEYRSETGHALQGVRGDVGFRAYWQRGKTRGASWFERTARWTLVNDTRAVKVNKVARVSLKGYRGAGLGAVHLKLLGTPNGMPLLITELEERLDAS